MMPQDDYGRSQRRGKFASDASRPQEYYYETGPDHHRKHRHRHHHRHHRQADADYQVEEVENESRSPSKRHKRHRSPPPNSDEDVAVEEVADQPTYLYGDEDIQPSRSDHGDRSRSLVR